MKRWVEWEDGSLTTSSRKQRPSADSYPFGAVAKHLPIPVVRPTAVRRWTSYARCGVLDAIRDGPECIYLALPDELVANGTRDIRCGKA